MSHAMFANGQLWTDFAYKMFNQWHQKSIDHTVTKYNHRQQSASVVTKCQSGFGLNTHVVKITNRECSCGKWTQFGIPCSHAQKVCAAYNINGASMVKNYYDVQAYKNTYSKAFQPLHPEDYWDAPEFQLVHDTTIRISTRSVGEDVSAHRRHDTGGANDSSPGAQLNHLSCCLFHAHGHSPSIDLHNGVELRKVELQNGLLGAADSSGVAEHYVEAAIRLYCPLHHGRNLFFIGHVALDVAAPSRADRFHHGSALFGLDIGDHYCPRTVFGEEADGSLSDATGPTGHYGYFALQLSVDRN
ncbi:UNVERIFIED_CONTAM: hypothetical protein Sradi_4035100 [Sesamum radiatum]|uniref:SWIM-type domain-containing protein n=1 Tax=Sesamum radiatum TaxID=300843 RepID=A0AAW2PJ23_SESRA